ncbi:hypothetical protein [Photobacterium leiognathi]|nr:hypothetical protein [Photobacterium leiognathi]
MRPLMPLPAIFGSGAFLTAATMVAGMALLGMVTSGFAGRG